MVTIGKEIQGDFNGDSKIESAFLESKLDKGTNMTEYTIVFSDSIFKPKTICITDAKKVQLINEGDLNDDNADDISISYELTKDLPISHMETRSFKNNEWNTIIKYFSTHPGFDTISQNKLQSLVTKKNDSVIYYTYGESITFDKNNKPIDTVKTRKAIKTK